MAGNQQVYLSWNKAEAASGYKIRRSTSRGGPYTTIKVGVESLCFWDWPLANGTPADVERDVIEHMDVMKPGGRWVAGSAHSIVNYIPHENFLAMINAFHKYGAY